MQYKKRLFAWITILLAVSCTRETKRMDDYAVQGIDISHHQQIIDWNKVADQDIDFVFVKATEGSEHQDTLFPKFWNDIKKAGLVRGAYHYFSPYSSAEEQAKHFIQTVQLEKGDLPPVLDVEIMDKDQNASPRQSALRWLQLIEKHYNVKPIIYTYQKFYLAHFTGEEFKDYPIWIARYNSPNNPPFIPFGRHWSFWQYGNCGHLTGIKGCVDFDVFHSDRESFEKLLYQSTSTDSAGVQKAL